MRFALLLIPAALAAQTPSIEQSLNFKTVSSPRISPDGRYIAYVVSEANWEDNSFQTQIWMAMTATGERYQLTHAKKSSSDPRWSPDSKRLAFLSDREANQQIYVISPAGGEATQLTRFEGGVSGFEWSPDGRHIVFASTGGDSKAKKDRKDKYGDFEIVEGDYTMRHLWLIATDDEKAKPEALTSGTDFSVDSYTWSPDSKRIAFAATRDPDLSSSATADIYVVRLSDKYVKKLVDATGPDRNPVWSPDGTQIAYQAGAEASYLNSRLAVVPADGGKPHFIAEGFDENAQLASWAASGLYFDAQQRTAAHLFRVTPATGKVDRVSAPADLQFNAPSFTSDYSQVAFTCSGPNKFTEICISSVASFAPKTVTNMSDQLRPFNLATREIFEWKSKDGTPIEGILIKPHDFDPTKKYPLLVVIHGGPTGVDRPSLAPDRTYPLEQFAAKGAVILRPNYRGSAGYGEKFRSLNVRNLGLGDHDDVISGVDALIAKGFVDRERVGSMGWSQGGYISAFLTTYSDRFKAVSVGAGISDWMTYYVNTDIHPFTRHYLKATPWDDPEIYRKTSPITYINRAKTPTLIQHGELDKRVPIPNAYELYQGLKDKGVPAKMIVYKGFGHGINKPKQQRAVMEHNYEWFSQWIWGEKAPASSGSPSTSVK
ncbi:MAG TPA: S9 family peptidase [Bryobacteraceae bacterium]|jgi:dipeptidyl aminopeptidase/acylaminoacyl peptidase|nr:S9 family peptidase [Bryobacteraceae bacterium]